jgi:hypothetical protein
MSLVIVLPLLLTASVIATLAWVLCRSMTNGSTLPLTAEWIEELSIERYKPMMRLLDGKDLEFLRSQPGFSPAMATSLRTQRSQIFRGYLKSLQTDFKRICTAIKVLMLQSGHDRPDLAAVLLRSQLLFATGMALVHFRLLLYRFNLCAVEADGLIKVFDLMRTELRTLVPAYGSLEA